LLYEHLDAGHPHIHIVTTNIQKDGKRISLHNIDKNQSNTARKEIEITYNLQKAEGQRNAVRGNSPFKHTESHVWKSATKRGITNVLDAVLSNYKYASLSELNAVSSYIISLPTGAVKEALFIKSADSITGYWTKEEI
jgi:Relaxase/Mobilisation nuclease domain